MFVRIDDKRFESRMIEFLEYVKLTNSFPTRGKKDIKFSDNSCLMGEWFKSNRGRIKSLTNNSYAKEILRLSDIFMTKTDKDSISNRFSERINEMISFIKINNYFPDKNDNVYFKDKSSSIYIWYTCNKNKLISLSLKGDIYAKELLSLEKFYRCKNKKNKYPKDIVYQGRKYAYKEFAKFLGVSSSILNDLMDDYCKDIYNIKSLELERIRNTIMNVKRLKHLYNDDDKYLNLNEKLVDFCNKKHLCLEVFDHQIGLLVNQGLELNEAQESVMNCYKNNGGIPISWIYDVYEQLSNDSLGLDKNIIIRIIMDNGLSFNQSVLFYVIDRNIKNSNEKDYFKDIVYYTLKDCNLDYSSRVDYSKNLFKLNDWKVNLINKIYSEYKDLISLNSIDRRKQLINDIISNYDDYCLNKKFFQDKYELTRFEIMNIEVRHNEVKDEVLLFKNGNKRSN